MNLDGNVSGHHNTHNRNVSGMLENIFFLFECFFFNSMNKQKNNGNIIGMDDVPNLDTNGCIVESNVSEQNVSHDNENNAENQLQSAGVNGNINTNFKQHQEQLSEKNQREVNEPKIIRQIDLTQDASENPLFEEYEIPRPINFKKEDPLSGTILFDIRVRRQILLHFIFPGILLNFFFLHKRIIWTDIMLKMM